MEKIIDPFEQIEKDSDRIVQAIRNIVAGAICVVGTVYLLWFWIFKNV